MSEAPSIASEVSSVAYGASSVVCEVPSSAASRETPRVGVVIPHYCAPEALERTLAAVRAQQGVAVEVFVRDNSDDNILFTRAVNEGLEKFCFGGRHDHVLVLNHDAVLRPGCLATLLRVMDEWPDAGICAPIQLSPDGAVTWFGSGQAFPFGVHGVEEPGASRAPFTTYWANGACMLLRSRMVREIGQLDRNMRFIFSDSDYSFTARARGWEVLAVPEAQVEHALASSGGDAPEWLRQVMVADALYFARKWLTGDLYRQLALEGDMLPPDIVQEMVAGLREDLDGQGDAAGKS